MIVSDMPLQSSYPISRGMFALDFADFALILSLRCRSLQETMSEQVPGAVYQVALTTDSAGAGMLPMSNLMDSINQLPLVTGVVVYKRPHPVDACGAHGELHFTYEITCWSL